MIKNDIEFLKKTFRCNEEVMRYLVYDCKQVILHYETVDYIFLDTEELRECLKKAPFLLKLKNGFFLKK